MSFSDIEKFKALELKKSLSQQKRFTSIPLPPFSFVGDASYNIETLRSKEELPIVHKRKNFFEFPSSLEPNKTVRFKHDIQKENTPGRKVALIHVMHWNGRLRAYDPLISAIRSTALPISTFIHIPAGRSLNPGIDGDPDYEGVGPNIDRVISVTQREITNLQIFARYLKEVEGFKEVGLFSYSLGSMYAFIAALVNPGLFDFGIFHTVADNFTDAVMKGCATQKIANQIRGKINFDSLKKYWEPLSPGTYINHFNNLPKHIRLIQCKYDYIFGQDNVTEFTRKLKRKRPDAEIIEVPTVHTGLGTFPITAEIMWNNIRFIYKHTHMKEHKRSSFFHKINSRY